MEREMTNKTFRFGPIALTTTLTTNLLNPPAASGGVNGGSSGQYIILSRVNVVNKTGSAATFSLWLGATGANAAGTEVIGQGQSVGANTYFPWSGRLRLDVADFLVGGSNTATALSIEGEGEIGVSG
ncbi:hypothetical protein HYZ97_03720 [Candidatus Pacearchaeota archaeon]|nr:hypothetical protein [Candidatus Pacearchaeota archaeon]